MQLGLTVAGLLDDSWGSRLLTHMVMLAGGFGFDCGELDCTRIPWDVVGAFNFILVCAAALDSAAAGWVLLACMWAAGDLAKSNGVERSEGMKFRLMLSGERF